jgi:hypothetical protein
MRIDLLSTMAVAVLEAFSATRQSKKFEDSLYQYHSIVLRLFKK